jgi:hypothetical protein
MVRIARSTTHLRANRSVNSADRIAIIMRRPFRCGGTPLEENVPACQPVPAQSGDGRGPSGRRELRQNGSTRTDKIGPAVGGVFAGRAPSRIRAPALAPLRGAGIVRRLCTP